MFLPILRYTLKEKRSAKDSSTDVYAIFLFCFFLCDFLYKSICFGYLSMQFKWIPTTFAFKKYTGCNLKTMELLDCALIGVYAVIRLNTVCEK